MIFPGDYSGEATPVTIPNTEVKGSSADGTSRVTSWESRSLPGIFNACCLLSGHFLFPKSSIYSTLAKKSHHQGNLSELKRGNYEIWI